MLMRFVWRTLGVEMSVMGRGRCMFEGVGGCMSFGHVA